jgi:hypothetical protein
MSSLEANIHHQLLQGEPQLQQGLGSAVTAMVLKCSHGPVRGSLEAVCNYAPGLLHLLHMRKGATLQLLLWNCYYPTTANGGVELTTCCADTLSNIQHT